MLLNEKDHEKVPSQEELKNSKRWFKSETPKYTTDWYIKWIASVFLLTGMSMRGIESFVVYDLSLSIVGVTGGYFEGHLVLILLFQ